MTALGLASLLAPLNSTMVAVALPEIRSHFDVGIVAVTWLVTGYLVAVAVAQPIGGRLGDMVGSLRVLKGGLLLIALFSLGSALSPNFETLVITRSLQGLAAALLIPNATAYIRRSTAPERLGRTLGLNGVFTASGAAAGPVVGGLLVAVGDWRLLFLANLPVVAVALTLVLLLRTDGGSGWRWSALQSPSIAALTAGFTGLALLGTALRSGVAWLPAGAALLAIAGALAYAALYKRRGAGIVDLRLFTRRTYATAAAMTGLTNMVMYTTLIAVPVYLRDHEDVGGAVIGGMLFAMSATMALISGWGGRLADNWGFRPMLLAGSVLTVLSAAATAVSVELPSLALLVVALGLMGCGMGLANPAQQTAGMAAWPATMAGSAAGTLSLMRYVGSVTGASMLAAILGADPSRSDFGILLGVLIGVAVANMAIAVLPGGGRPRELATSAA
jgi:MFS family permease